MNKTIFKKSRFLTAAAMMFASPWAFANVLPPNAVPEPGMLSLVMVAVGAAVYASRRGK